MRDGRIVVVKILLAAVCLLATFRPVAFRRVRYTIDPAHGERTYLLEAGATIVCIRVLCDDTDLCLVVIFIFAERNNLVLMILCVSS